MRAFGQNMVDKAKNMIAPRNEWLFEFKNLTQNIDDGREINKSIKVGKIHVKSEGLHFINESKPRDNFTIDDYDHIHAIVFNKQGKRYYVNIKGRKMRDDDSDVLQLLDLVKKHMLTLTIKEVNLGGYKDIQRGDEICVRVDCGNFHTRTSYITEQGDKLTINEIIVIDLDNDDHHSVYVSVSKIQKNKFDQFEKYKMEPEELGRTQVFPDEWPPQNKSKKIAILDEEGNDTGIVVNMDAFMMYEKPTQDTKPSLLEGKVMLYGRDVLYMDDSPIQYPPNQAAFDLWGCVGKFDKSKIGQKILPLCAPTKEQFKLHFHQDHGYETFMNRYHYRIPENRANPLLPHVFRMPFSQDEFDGFNFNSHYSGNYDALSKAHNPGDLVEEITHGPVLKPAKLLRVDLKGNAEIEYSIYDEKSQDIVRVRKIVPFDKLEPHQYAGPSLHVDDKNYIENTEYDLNLECVIEEEDMERFLNAISFRSNQQYLQKLQLVRNNPARYLAKPKADFGNTKHITGDLIITIVSARNLSTQYGNGDVYVEIKSYEHNYEEDQFGNFALDDSFIKGKESQSRMTRAKNVTSSVPIEKNTVFDEDKNMGTFVKGATHEIKFIVKQEQSDGDIELGVASIKTDDFLDPYRPAKELYLLLDDPPYFVSSLYLNVLFLPSENTLRRMGIKEHVPTDFDQAYNKWILSRTVYVDKYGFTVPLGKYHPRLITAETFLESDESDQEYDDRGIDSAMRRNRKKTPEKRVRHAVDLLPALKDYNTKLKMAEKNRPEHEEVLFHFKQLQLYVNNEAKVKANELRQEYCWTDYVAMVTDQIHDMSVEQEGDEEGDDIDFNRRRGHMLSVAKRSTWNRNSEKNIDIWALCRLGIAHNYRNRIWYDLLEAQTYEEVTDERLRSVIEAYDRDLTTYENLKILSTQHTNIAFAQVDEDMNILDVSNTPARDERGQIKNILKCFIAWQQLTDENLCYSINFGYIIQRLLSIFTEEKAFWMFLAIIIKMKDRIGVDESIMLSRKGMFRMLSTCLCSHTKETYPEVFAKFTEVGFSLDFFLYDQMSSLFSNCFASDTLLRLWDLIFLEFSSPSGGGKTKGLGYIISTCLYLINVNREQIMLSTTPEELQTALYNSRSVLFNTEEIIEKIYEKNTLSFVAGNWFARRLASVSKVFGDAASYLDNARIALEEDYDLIFEKTMRENRMVWQLFGPDHETFALDYSVWGTEDQDSIVAKFKKCFGQVPSKWYNKAGHGTTEGNLELSTVYIFVYNCFDVQNIGKPSIDLNCQYAKTKKSCPIEKYDKMTIIEHCFKLRYEAKNNAVKLYVNEGKKLFGSITLDLNDYKPNQVYKHWIDIINEEDNENDLEFEVGVFCEVEERYKDDMSQIFKDSLKRKLPDRIDILNEVNESNFIDKSKDSLISQLEFEKEVLGEYFSEKEITAMINYKYNYILNKQTMDMGYISLDDLRLFNQRVLFSNWDELMPKLYDQFTTTTKQSLENRTGDSNNILDRAAVLLLTKTLARRNNKLFGLDYQDSDAGFNLRNFIVTLVLMSALTVGQKLDILYEIFDWDDGEGDGLDSQAIKLMLNTILNRNLQYVPSNQVNNMTELLFDGDASSISSCVYTCHRVRDRENVPFDYAVKALKLVGDHYYSEDEEDHIETIDLTEVFQDLLWKYHRFFGCKSLCFHPQYSPFRDLQQVMKLSKQDIYLKKRKYCENILCIVYFTNGIKRVFTAYYNGDHKLVRVGEDLEKDQAQDYHGIDKILQDNKFFCNVQNFPRSIPKDTFITRSLSVPYLSDFMRTETVMRFNETDIVTGDLAVTLDSLLTVTVTNQKGRPLAVCEFERGVPLEYDPSLTHKLIDNDRIRQYVGEKKGIVHIKMSPAYKQDSLSDIADRIKMAVKLVQAELKLSNQEAEDLDFDTYKWGFRDGNTGREPLSTTIELEEVVKENGYSIAFVPVITTEA